MISKFNKKYPHYSNTGQFYAKKVMITKVNKTSKNEDKIAEK